MVHPISVVELTKHKGGGESRHAYSMVCMHSQSGPSGHVPVQVVPGVILFNGQFAYPATGLPGNENAGGISYSPALAYHHYGSSECAHVSKQ